MDPPQMHVFFAEFTSMGLPKIFTIGLTGVHGDGTTGTQGIGVKTPLFAMVAANTTGFLIFLHIPKGKMLKHGIKSMTDDDGKKQIVTGEGRGIRGEGAAPKEHLQSPVRITGFPIFPPNSRYLKGISEPSVGYLY